MSRNLVICCDGTWNTPRQKDRGQLVPSNVVKMSRLAKSTDQQIVYYDTGVGTDSKWHDQIIGGATGSGISKNIIQAYRYICENYQQGDKLYLFGFSRGAYTVRSLAGLILAAGIVDTKSNDCDEKIVHAYELYRGCKGSEGKEKLEGFKSNQIASKVHFVGVWDTVGALGVPKLTLFGSVSKLANWVIRKGKYQYVHGFHDVNLCDDISYAYHALAIDEMRGPFRPTLWEGKDRENVEQVWFSGVHTNVGGGYVDCGLSDHALIWMAVKAFRAGLDVDMQYLAKRVDPNCHGELRDSMSVIYKLTQAKRTLVNEKAVNLSIHQSALNRMEHPSNDYKPLILLDAKAKATLPVTRDGLNEIEQMRRASSISTWGGLKPTQKT